MKISELFKTTNFNNSILLGYYGGGNFGDELLLEVLLHKLSLEKFKNLKVFYLGYVDFDKYHFSFKNVEVINFKKSKWKLFLESLHSENIIVGGGGLWGLDFNSNVLIFSFYLFLMRFIFFKKVYLIGVGFYNSTTRVGRLMGWFSAKAANLIIARDEETFENFNRTSKDKIFLDKDIVFYLKEFLNKNIEINKDVEKIKKNFPGIENGKINILFVHRRFKDEKNKKYLNAVENYIRNSRDAISRLSIMEPKHIDKLGFEAIKKIGDSCDVKYFDFDFNPLDFYFFLKEYGSNMIIVAPQYHVQLVAYLTGVSFMPISYDNKCVELFKILGINKYYDINEIKAEDIDDFTKLIRESH